MADAPYQIDHIRRRDQMRAADRLGVDLAVVQGVTAVEAAGRGFLRGTTWPTILFEGHQFHRFTDGRFDSVRPDLSHPRWTKAHYKGGRGEYDRLLGALALIPDDPEPALKAASWGMFQIMGFNHDRCGFADARGMVNAFSEGEGRQMDGFTAFVLGDGAMARALRSGDWAGFARRYNGPGYAVNAYDTKLRDAVARARAALAAEAGAGRIAMERGDVADLQRALNRHSGAGLAVDGVIGPRTKAALRGFQSRTGLPASGVADRATADALGLLTTDTGA